MSKYMTYLENGFADYSVKAEFCEAMAAFIRSEFKSADYVLFYNEAETKAKRVALKDLAAHVEGLGISFTDGLLVANTDAQQVRLMISGKDSEVSQFTLQPMTTPTALVLAA